MKTSIRHIAAFIAVLFAIVACGPSRYMIDVEMRHKSKAGVDLTGKNVAVVYGATSEYPLGGFVESLADGCAWNLQADYQHTIDSIGVFGISVPASEYASRDSLVALLMETGSDVIFLFDKVELGDMSNTATAITLPFAVSLRCYDAMNQDDRMQTFTGSSTARPATMEQLANEAWDAGKTIASSFKPDWKREQYSIYYFDNESWLSALMKAEMYDWKGAMDIWFGFLDSNDVLKRSCACYNIATSCYMLGDYALASEWLDRSDQDNPLPLSAALRKRINARK